MPGQKFDDNYRESCFQIWYSAGCPTLQKTQELLPKLADGTVPSYETLSRWMDQDWKLRADSINAQAQELAEANLIQQKAEMLIQQAERGRKLQVMGIDYLEKENFDSSSSAVSAVINGAKLEQESRGISALLLKMAKMSDGELQQEIVKRLTALQEDKENTVDADTVSADKEDDESSGGV